VIELRHVNLVFSSSSGIINALRDVSLSFSNTGLVIVSGPSGCGKSSLLNIVGLLIKPTSGSLCVNGENTSGWKQNRRERYVKNELAILFQDFHLLDGFSAWDNVAMPLLLNGIDHDTIAKDVNGIFSAFNLLGVINQTPDTLSGGEAQRVALMRSLVKRTPVILADEPTGALDADSAEHLMATLKKVASEKLVIIVTHNKELALKYANRHIEMASGQIVSDVVLSQSLKLRLPNVINARHPRVSLLYKHLIEREWPRMLLAYVSLVIAIVSSLITIGISEGAKITPHERAFSFLDSNVVFIRKEERIPLNSTPLNLIRYRRPLESEMNQIMPELGLTYYDVSLSGLLTANHKFKLATMTFDDIAFKPFFDDGPIASDAVIINDTAATMLGESGHDIVESGISYECQAMFTFEEETIGTVNDLFDVRRELKIASIIYEKHIQSLPTIYYPHAAWSRYLATLEVENLSRALGYPIDWLMRIKMARDDETITNQEMVARIDDEKKIRKLYEEKPLEGYGYHGTYFSDRHLMASILNTLDYSLSFFVGLAGVCGTLTLWLSLTHIQNRHRKKTAIIWHMGLNRRHIGSIFQVVGLTIAITSLLTSFLITPLLAALINSIVELRTPLGKLIRIPWAYFHEIYGLLPLGITLFVTIIALAVGHFTISSIKYSRLIEELQADD